MVIVAMPVAESTSVATSCCDGDDAEDDDCGRRFIRKIPTNVLATIVVVARDSRGTTLERTDRIIAARWGYWELM